MAISKTSLLQAIEAASDGVSAALLAQRFAVSRATLRSVLNELRGAGLIRVVGRGPATRYQGLGPLHELHAYIARPVTERPVARFNPQFLTAFGGEQLSGIEVSPASLQPLDPAAMARQTIDFACASSALEGAHYSVVEAMTLLEYDEMAAGKPREDGVLVRNHATAYRHLFVRRQLADLFTLHALLTEDGDRLDLAESQHCLPARYRGVLRGNDQAVSAASSYQPPFGEALLEQGVATILATAGKIAHPLQAAFYLATRLPYLQAFRDGNKRLARAMSAIPLLQAGWPPISYAHFNRHDYLSGLLVFFELGDPRLAEEGFLAAYRKTLAAERLRKS